MIDGNVGSSNVIYYKFNLGAILPTVFASVSVTLILFYLATLGMAYIHQPPLTLEFHMIWGLFTATLIVLLQCLIFGFFIGSGKSIKRVVQENGLDQGWIQKTKDYKNKSYPALMLAILFSTAAAILGGGVAAGAVPVWVHQVLVWTALILNIRSLWISYRVVVENVNAIHRINQEVQNLKAGGQAPIPPAPTLKEKMPIAQVRANQAANYYFLSAAVWVPYLYMRWSLGSRTFPLWPFLGLSGVCVLVGVLKSRKYPSA